MDNDREILHFDNHQPIADNQPSAGMVGDFNQVGICRY